MKVIEQSFELYRRGFFACLPLSIIIGLGIFAPTLLFDYTDTNTFFNFMMSWQDYNTVILIVSWCVTFIALCTLILRINSLYNHQQPVLLNDIKDALSDFFPLLLIGFLYTFLVICGIAIFIIPGIILSISLMFSFIIRLIDHTDVLDSLVKSHHLVWGHWWYTALVSSVPYLINVVMFLSLYLLTVGVLTNFIPVWPYTAEMALLLNGILQVLFIPFIIGTMICLLYDLKSKRLPS